MEFQNRTPLTPSNPIGYGISQFLDSFARGIEGHSKDMDKERQRNAYIAYLEQKLNAGQQKTPAEIALLNAKSNYYNKGGSRSAASKIAPGDKYFMQNFTKARDTFLTKYAQPYRHPNMLTNMDLAQKLQGMTDEQRQQQAEIDFAKDDPTGHDLISNPDNIAHYKSLIAPVSGSPIAPPAGAPAPGAAPPPAANPMVPKGSPFSMAPTPTAPTAMAAIPPEAAPTEEIPAEITDENPEA